MFNRRNPKTSDGLPSAKILPLRNRKSIVALDLEAGTLRIAQASGPGSSVRVTRLVTVKLDILPEKLDDPVALGTAIKSALGSMRFSPREAVLSLSRAQVVLRPLQVPAVADIRELASIINFQIARDLPFRLEDAVIDFKVLRQIDAAPEPTESVLPSPENGSEGSSTVSEKRLDVLVGAVRSDVVEFYRELSKVAGFRLGALGLRSIAAIFCASRCGLGQDATVLLVCVRQDETTIEIAIEGKLVFSRAAALSVRPDPDQAAAFREVLEIEVVRSVHSFEGTAFQRPIEKVFVAGGTGCEGGISESLGKRLNIPSQILDPSACLDIKRGESGDAAAAIAPIGLALSALELGGLALDFANPKKPATPGNKKRTQLLVAAVAAVVVLLGLFAIRLNLVKNRLKIKQDFQAQLADAEKKLPIYRRLKAQAKVVNSWTADDQNWLDHLAYLSAVLPGADEMFVSAFTTSPQHLIRFSVQARSGELLAELDKKLRAAGYEVRPLSITPANDRNGYSFRTTVELSVPKKLKPDLAKVKPPARPADDASLKTAHKPS